VFFITRSQAPAWEPEQNRTGWKACATGDFLNSESLLVFVVIEGYFIQGGIGGEGDAHPMAALLRVPEIAALPHAEADVGEGAVGGGVGGHVLCPTASRINQPVR